MLKMGILVSGGGTNLQALIDKIDSGYLKGVEIATVVSSSPGAYALERAAKRGIPHSCIARRDFSTIEEYTKSMVNHFEKAGVGLIVMAGYISFAGAELIKKYENRIINVHPSLIPAFCGKGHYGIKVHEKALEYGVKVTGATVHFVNEEYDSGAIILQKAVEILYDDTPEVLQKRVMEQAEWEILPEAVKLFAEGRLKIEGRKVRIV